jgi:hypothetical protein
MSSEYMAELARQIGFVSAFLGGVAAAFPATLVTLQSPRRIVGRTIVCAAATAIAFVVAVLGSFAWLALLHPGAPKAAQGAMREAQLLAALPFSVGILLLMATIGMAGWIRSKQTGRATTFLAVIGAILAVIGTVDWG